MICEKCHRRVEVVLVDEDKVRCHKCNDSLLADTLTNMTYWKNEANVITTLDCIFILEEFS